MICFLNIYKEYYFFFECNINRIILMFLFINDLKIIINGEIKDLGNYIVIIN